MQCLEICNVWRYAMSGDMQCLEICNVWRYAMSGDMQCLEICNVWRYAMSGDMQCLEICNVWRYAMSGDMQCLEICNVWRYAMSGDMQCLEICNVWRYATVSAMYHSLIKYNRQKTGMPTDDNTSFDDEVTSLLIGTGELYERRRAIIRLINLGFTTPSKIAKEMSINPTKISKYLRELKNAGVLGINNNSLDARENCYYVKDEKLEKSMKIAKEGIDGFKKWMQCEEKSNGE